MMLESAGFDMVDLGVDVPADKFVEAVKENNNVVLVACSGLLTTTMPALKEAVQTIKAAYPDMKVIVGGARLHQSTLQKSAPMVMHRMPVVLPLKPNNRLRLSRYKNSNNYPK